MTATLPNIFQIPKEIFLIFPKRALTFHIFYIYLCAFIIGELKLSGKASLFQQECILPCHATKLVIPPS